MSRPTVWLSRHLQVLLASLGRLWQRPLGSLMSILMIAIAMALPLGLYLVVDNLQRLSLHWQGGASATLFLRADLEAREIPPLLAHLRRDPRIERLHHLTPEQAMAEFRRHSGLGDALALLEQNPLPHVVLIETTDSDPQALARLMEKLRRDPRVERALADLEWLRRFRAMVEILERSTQLLAIALGMAVLLVIGNTVRLEIQHRRREIEIMKLVGADTPFIRRPFLYEGFWYGLLGAVGAWLLILGAGLLLSPSITRLSALYGSAFHLQGPGMVTTLALLGGGALLGIAGAWLAVGRQLNAIEPGKP